MSSSEPAALAVRKALGILLKRSVSMRRPEGENARLASPRSGMPVRIILADDHAVVRQALSLLLAAAGFDVVGQASDGQEAVRLAKELQPDVAVLDVVMPLLNGLDAAREIQQASPRTRAILLTSRRDEQLIQEALKAGIKGCVQKTHQAQDLIQAIRDVAAGRVYRMATLGL